MMLSDPSHIVRQARNKIHLNQRDFAIRIGKTQSVLSRYECGKVNPPVRIVMHCLHILNDDSKTSDIEQIVAKFRKLDGDQYKKLREALNILLDMCV